MTRTHPSAGGATLKFSEVQDLYAQSLGASRHLSPHTVRAYTSDTGRLAAYLGPWFDVSGSAHGVVEGLVAALRDCGAADASIRRTVSGLRAFSRWLFARGHGPGPR